MLLDGRAQTTGIKRRGSDATLLIVFNAHHDVVKFRLPLYYEAYGWNSADRHQRPGVAGAKIQGRRRIQGDRAVPLDVRARPNPRRDDGRRRRGRPSGLRAGNSSPSRAEAKQPLREDGGASSSHAATSPSL